MMMNATTAPDVPGDAASVGAPLPDASIVAAVEQHLREHPHAADTATGVANWWLGARGIHATAEAVECALAAMVRQQRLRRTMLADRSVLYSGPTRSDAP